MYEAWYLVFAMLGTRARNSVAAVGGHCDELIEREYRDGIRRRQSQNILRNQVGIFVEDSELNLDPGK